MATRPVGTGGGDSGDKRRWAETNSSKKKKKKLHSSKLQDKSRNPIRIPRPQQQQYSPTAAAAAAAAADDDDDGSNSSEQLQHMGTVASDDSSSGNRQQPASQNPTNGDPLPGYVKFDNMVRVSLNSRSKLEIRELKRKLVSELDKVRSFKRRFEVKEVQCNGYDDNGMGNACNRVATLARVNSEVSYVGPTNLRPVQELTISVDYNDKGNAGEHVDKERRAPKVNQNRKSSDLAVRKDLNPKVNKKLKSSGEVKRDGGGSGSGTNMYHKKLFDKCRDLLEMLMKHQYGWVFKAPVDVKKLNLHDYYDIIKHPMDLGTVKSRLNKNLYKSPKQFAEDVRLTFKNAMTYNEKGQDVHYMADVLLKIFEEKWGSITAQLNVEKKSQIGRSASLPTSTSKRGPAPPPPAATSDHVSAPTPSTPTPSLTMPVESTALDRLETMSVPPHSNLKAANIDTNQIRTPVSKKPMAKDPEERELTYVEKQRLSVDLQNMPSEKLETVVQIIRRRNPGLFQEEDEIEVDIDCFDTETLWELYRFVTNYKESLSKNNIKTDFALQGREEVSHNIHDINQTSVIAEAMKEPEAVVEKIVNTSPPLERERQNDNVSASSSSSSSSSESGSSSRDSDSDTSGYGSDAGH